MTKRIVLCADDYGQAPEISKAIIFLIQHGRVTATSCLVNSIYWSEHATWLKPYLGQVDLGLHFNLTEGNALSPVYKKAYGQAFMPLATVLRRSFMGGLKQEVIEAELNAQIDQFQQKVGMLPCYVDGHQHVHQFPIIREALVNVYEDRLRASHSYIRLINESVSVWDALRDFKKFVIVKAGTKALKKLLNQHNIPHNQTFAGIYSFNTQSHYDRLFAAFLGKVKEGGIIMCHPGLLNTDTSDPIAHARFKEYQYLTSGKFLEDCFDHDVALARFKAKKQEALLLKTV